MKHARDIKVGELSEGDKFLYSDIGSDNEVGEVKSIKLTPKGRVKFEIILSDGQISKWSNGAMSKNSYMQS